MKSASHAYGTPFTCLQTPQRLSDDPRIWICTQRIPTKKNLKIFVKVAQQVGEMGLKKLTQEWDELEKPNNPDETFEQRISKILGTQRQQGAGSSSAS